MIDGMMKPVTSKYNKCTKIKNTSRKYEMIFVHKYEIATYILTKQEKDIYNAIDETGNI